MSDQLAALLESALGETCEVHSSCPRDTSRHGEHASAIAARLRERGVVVLRDFDHFVQQAHPETRQPAAAPDAERLRKALEVIRELHSRDPEGGQGFDGQSRYVQKADVCRTCGTPDEYGVDWPCKTRQAAEAILALLEGPTMTDPLAALLRDTHRSVVDYRGDIDWAGYAARLRERGVTLTPDAPEGLRADHPLSRGCCALAGELHPGRPLAAALAATPDAPEGRSWREASRDLIAAGDDDDDPRVTIREKDLRDAWLRLDAVGDPRTAHTLWQHLVGVAATPDMERLREFVDAETRDRTALLDRQAVELKSENARLRRAIEDFILWWDMPPFALDDDERLRAEVDALRAALGEPR